MSDEIRLTLEFNGVPVYLAVALMSAIDRAAEREGFKAFYREETGFGTLYLSRIQGHDE